MVDLATRDGLELDANILSRELGVPVVSTVAVRKRGLDHLKTELETLLGAQTGMLRASAGLPETVT